MLTVSRFLLVPLLIFLPTLAMAQFVEAEEQEEEPVEAFEIEPIIQDIKLDYSSLGFGALDRMAVGVRVGMGFSHAASGVFGPFTALDPDNEGQFLEAPTRILFPNLTAGATFSYDLFSWLGFTTGLHFLSTGFKYNDGTAYDLNYNIDPANPFTQGEERDLVAANIVTLSYLQLPLSVRFHPFGLISTAPAILEGLYVRADAVIGFKLGQNRTVNGRQAAFYDCFGRTGPDAPATDCEQEAEIDAHSNLSTAFSVLAIDLEVGAGIRMPIFTPNLLLVADVGYKFGFFDFALPYNDEAGSERGFEINVTRDRTNQPLPTGVTGARLGVFMVSLGLELRLSQFSQDPAAEGSASGLGTAID